MDMDMNNGILSLVLGLLLSISEILPYIKSIEGNGIINILHTFITKQQEIGHNLIEHNLLEHETETEPLLQEQPQQPLLQDKLSLDLSTINNTLKLNTEKLTTFSLKTPDEYQLMYIDNYMKTNFKKRLEFHEMSDNNIELLRKLSYKIDYNSRDDTYLVHW
jgi:hypothetical protein